MPRPILLSLRTNPGKEPDSPHCVSRSKRSVLASQQRVYFLRRGKGWHLHGVGTRIKRKRRHLALANGASANKPVV